MPFDIPDRHSLGYERPFQGMPKGQMRMPILRNTVDVAKFNPNAVLPYELRHEDFQMAMQDVYDFFFDVNSHLARKGLQRLDDMLRPVIMSVFKAQVIYCLL
ncbi:MAG: hypothetical protein IT365_00955 [Candidatus Hydrogenedentes bacterium]|nr:hypothetical protein [Candidatus Hydrogenedentota bacterium]